MMPSVAATGHSFKGAFAYYMHDKGTDADGRRLATSERVAWSETRNLATDGPHTACRIMIATAQQADELKAAAGIKRSGQPKKNGPVYSYSLSWRTDEAEGVSRAEMVKAAEDTLKLLKCDHLQAVIIAHRDTENPHVHVIVNRVNPKTGKMDGQFTRDFPRLQAWAGKYERDRGMIVTPSRQAKEAARQANPDPEKRREYVKNRIEEQKRRPSPAAALKARDDAQKAAHTQAWAKLSAAQKARRKAIYEATDQGIKERIRAAREEHRPLWSDLYRRQKDERRAYDARERHLSGKVRNAIDAVRTRQIRGDGSDRGFLTMAFGYLASRDARRAELDGRHVAEREKLAETTKNRTDAEIQKIKEVRAAALSQSRDVCNKQAAALKTEQAKERQSIRAEWKAIYQQKEQARTTQERQPREYRPRVRPERQAAAETRATVRPTQPERPTQTTRPNTPTRRTDSPRLDTMPTGEQPAPKEQADMKGHFDWARGVPPKQPPAPVPNRTVSLSRPAPAPSPAGEVPPVNRKPAEVPAIDKDAGMKRAGEGRPTPAPKKEFQVQTRPAAAAPKAPERPQQPPAPQQPARAAFDWKAAQTRQAAPQPAPKAQERPQQPPAPPKAPERLKPPEVKLDLRKSITLKSEYRPEPSKAPERPKAPECPPEAKQEPRKTIALKSEYRQEPPKAPERPKPPEQRPEPPKDSPRVDWSKAAAPTPPAPEPSRETPRFDWGKAVEPSRDPLGDLGKPRDRSRDFDRDR